MITTGSQTNTHIICHVTPRMCVVYFNCDFSLIYELVKFCTRPKYQRAAVSIKYFIFVQTLTRRQITYSQLQVK